MNSQGKTGVNDLLLEGEKQICVARVHWGIFLAPGLYNLTGVLLWIFFHPLMGGAVIFMALYPTVTALIKYLTTRLLVTDRRVVARAGFFTRDIVQMKLDRVESAYLEQPLLGQIIGYATVIVRGVGTASIPIPFIANGKNFVQTLEGMLSPGDRAGKSA